MLSGSWPIFRRKKSFDPNYFVCKRNIYIFEWFHNDVFFCFQKIRTIELDGKTIKLQIVSKHFLSLLLIINFIITCNKFNLIRDIVCFSK